MRSDGGLGKQVDDLTVLRPGLEHLGLTASAPGLHIDHEADMFGQGVILEKCLCSQEPGFLAVGDQNNHVAGGWLPLQLQGANNLQRGADPGCVIGSARGGGYAVIVSHQRQRRGRAVAPGPYADNILHLRTKNERLFGPRDAPRHRGALNLRRQPQSRHATDQVVSADPIFDGPDRVRHGGDGAIIDHGPRG